MQLPSLPAAEGVTMEAMVMLECSSAHEMMVMENVPVNLAETVLPLGSFVGMTALESMLRCRSWCSIIRL